MNVVVTDEFCLFFPVYTELQRVVEPVEEQLNTTIAQKLTATDQLMKENISKLVKSRVSLLQS